MTYHVGVGPHLAGTVGLEPCDPHNIELGMAIVNAIAGIRDDVCIVRPLAGVDGLECSFYRHPMVDRFATVEELLKYAGEL